MLAGRLAAATVAYSILAVALLAWALATAPSSPQAIGPTRTVERLVPGGVTTIGLAWGTAFAVTSLVALVRGAAKATLLVTLVAFLFTWAFLEAWAWAVALPTQGGISPGEVWLYFGSRWFFLGAGLLVAAAAAIRWPPRS
jgi:hypothetical protein